MKVARWVLRGGRRSNPPNLPDRNGQLKPGYNVQIAVSGEYIVGVDISSERSDSLTLIPFLKRLEILYPTKWRNIVADAGYESEENYMYLKKFKYNSYIKPINHETKKKKKYKDNIGRMENMKYDEESDTFICSNGKSLHFKGLSYSKSKSGYEKELRNYECEDCIDCGVRLNCTKSKPEKNKKIKFSANFNKLRSWSESNINTNEGIALRINRSIQVEGAFGVVKQDFGFRRFLRRGTGNVRIEFLVLAIAFNIRKYHNKKVNDRLGVSKFNNNIA